MNREYKHEPSKRYELRTGKYGLYFHDTRGREGVALHTALDMLNQGRINPLELANLQKENAELYETIFDTLDLITQLGPQASQGYATDLYPVVSGLVEEYAWALNKTYVKPKSQTYTRTYSPEDFIITIIYAALEIPDSILSVASFTLTKDCTDGRITQGGTITFDRIADISPICNAFDLRLDGLNEVGEEMHLRVNGIKLLEEIVSRSPIPISYGTISYWHKKVD